MSLFLKNLPKSFFREIISSRPIFNKATSLFSSIANHAQKPPVYAVGRNYARSICFESHNEDKKKSFASKYPIYRRKYSKKVKKSSLEASKKPSKAGVDCTVKKGVVECTIDCAALGKGTEKIEACADKKSATKIEPPKPKKKLPKYKKEESQSSRPDVQALTGTWVSKKCLKFDFSCKGVKLDESHRPIKLEDKKPSQLFQACQKASAKEVAEKASKTSSKVSLSSKGKKGSSAEVKAAELVEPCQKSAKKSQEKGKVELVDPCPKTAKKPSSEKADQSPVMECIAICKTPAKKPSNPKNVGQCSKAAAKKEEKSCKPCSSKTEKKKVGKSSSKVGKKASKEKKADPCSKSKEVEKSGLAGGVEEDSLLDDKCREIIKKLRKELEECRKMNAKDEKNPCVDSPKLDSKLPEAKSQDKDVISGSKSFIKSVCGGMFKDKPSKSRSAPVVKKRSKKVRATKSEDLKAKPRTSSGEIKKSKKEEKKKKVCKKSKSKEKKVASGLVYPCKNASKSAEKKSKDCKKKESKEKVQEKKSVKKPTPPCTYTGPKESKSKEKEDPCAKYKTKASASKGSIKPCGVQKKKSQVKTSASKGSIRPCEVQKKKSKVKTSAFKGTIKPCEVQKTKSSEKSKAKSSDFKGTIRPCESSDTKKKIKCEKSAEVKKKKSATKTSSKCAIEKKEESKPEKTCSSPSLKKKPETPELQDQSPIMQCIAMCRANKPQKGKGVPPRDKKPVSSDTDVSKKKERKKEVKEVRPCMYESKPGNRKPEEECGEKEEKAQKCQEEEKKDVMQASGKCPKFKHVCPSPKESKKYEAKKEEACEETSKDQSVSEDQEIEEQRRRVEEKNDEIIKDIEKKKKEHIEKIPEKKKIEAAGSSIFKNIYSFFSLKTTPKETKSTEDILNAFKCEEYLKNKEKSKEKLTDKEKLKVEVKSTTDVCKKESKPTVKDKIDTTVKKEDTAKEKPDEAEKKYVCLRPKSKTKFETSLTYGQFRLCPEETEKTAKKKNEENISSNIDIVGQLPKSTKTSAGLLCKTEDNKAIRLKHTDSNEEKDCEEQSIKDQACQGAEEKSCEKSQKTEEEDKFEECVEELECNEDTKEAEYEVVKVDKQRCPKFKNPCPDNCEESKEKENEEFEECLEEINEEECKKSGNKGEKEQICEDQPKQQIKLIYPSKPEANHKPSNENLKNCKSPSKHYLEKMKKREIRCSKLKNNNSKGNMGKKGSKTDLSCKPSKSEMTESDDKKLPAGENTSLMITPYKKSSSSNKDTSGEILKLLKELKKDVEECKKQIESKSSKSNQKSKAMGPCMESPNLTKTLPKVSQQKKGAVGGSVNLVKDICKAFSPAKNVKPKKTKSADALMKKSSNQKLKKTKSNNETVRKQTNVKKAKSNTEIKKTKECKNEERKGEESDNNNLRYCCRFTRKEMDKTTRDNAVRDRKKLKEKETGERKSESCSKRQDNLHEKKNKTLVYPCPVKPPEKKLSDTKSPCRNENTTKPLTACSMRNFSMKDDQCEEKKVSKCKSSSSVDKKTKKHVKEIKSCSDRFDQNSGKDEIKQFVPCKTEEIKPGIREPDEPKGSKQKAKPSAPCKYTSPTRTKKGKNKKEEIKLVVPCPTEEIKPDEDSKTSQKDSKQWVRPPPPCKTEPPKMPKKEEKPKKESKKEEIKQFVPCRTEIIKPGIREPDEIKVGKSSKRWVRPRAPCEYTAPPERKSKPSKCIMDKYTPPKFIYPCKDSKKKPKEECEKKKLVHPCPVKKKAETGKSFTIDEKKLKPLVVCKKPGEIKLKQCKPGGRKPEKKEKIPHLVTCADKPCQHQKKKQKCASEPSLREKPQKPVKKTQSLEMKIKKCLFGGKSKSRPVVSTKEAMKAKSLDACKEGKKTEKKSSKKCEKKEKPKLVKPCPQSKESSPKDKPKLVEPCPKMKKSCSKEKPKPVQPCPKKSEGSGKTDLKPLVECVGVCHVKNQDNNVKKLVEFYDSKDKCKSSEDSVDVLVPPKYNEIVSKIDQKVVKVQCFTVENEKGESCEQKEEIKQFVPCKYEEIKPGIRNSKDECQKEGEKIKKDKKECQTEANIKLVFPCKHEDTKPGIRGQKKDKKEAAKPIKKCPKFRNPCPDFQNKKSGEKGKQDKCQSENKKDMCKTDKKEIKDPCLKKDKKSKCKKEEVTKCEKKEEDSCKESKEEVCKSKEVEETSKCEKKKEDVCKENKEEICPKEIKEKSECEEEVSKCETKKEDVCKEEKKEKDVCPDKEKETKCQKEEATCPTSTERDACKEDKEEVVASSKTCPKFKNPCPDTCEKEEEKCQNEKEKEDMCKGDAETCKPESCEDSKNICEEKTDPCEESQCKEDKKPDPEEQKKCESTPSVCPKRDQDACSIYNDYKKLSEEKKKKNKDDK